MVTWMEKSGKGRILVLIASLLQVKDKTAARSGGGRPEIRERR